MEFVEFNRRIQEQFSVMCKTGKLFRSSLSGQELWDLYLGSFKTGNNPVFRDPSSSQHNGNNDNSFMRRYGNIVAVDENNNIISLFDLDLQEDSKYYDSALALSSALRTASIKDVFFETFDELKSLPYESCSKNQGVFRLGIASNHKVYTQEEADKFGVVTAGEIYKFNHFHLDLPIEFVDMSSRSVESIMSDFRSSKEVFKRGMDEISLDTLKLVVDLINQGSLLDGQTHLHKVKAMIILKEEYDRLPLSTKDNWSWLASYLFPLARFRNELIGVLCVELFQGEELNKACQNWNKRVDPANYMKAVAPFTENQKKAALKVVEEGGYMDSFNRRLATIDDIKISEILHSNVGDGSIKSTTIFDGLKSSASTRHKRSEFDGVEEVSIEKFMKDILPGCTSIEVLVNNSHEQNMVTLTTANDPESKPMFKWDNNYSWTFNGNLAGKSQIKEEVKLKGGRVDGVLRFSMIWNDDASNPTDNSDLDAWCRQPDNVAIGYNSGYRKDSGNKKTACSGQLDLDNTSPNGKLAVENIYFSDLSQMKEGTYTFWINQYSSRNSKGFKAEIEFNGELYSYEYNRSVSGNVQIAEVTLKNGVFTIAHKLPCTDGVGVSKEIYGIETNKFHKVNLVCLSPNHWGENAVGNKHYFFMIDGCKTDSDIRSYHIENLNSELAAERKVLEPLASTIMLKPESKQLSGLGFNATVREELIVKLQGTHKRVIKIKF